MLEDAEQLRLLYQEIPVGCLVLDAQLVVREANAFGCDQLGYSHDDLLGMPFHRLCHHQEREYLEQNLHTCIRERAGQRRWECMRQRKDGSRFWVRDTVRVVDAGGTDCFVLISSEDITETRYLINELERKSSTDELTGLYNRHRFDFSLEEHLLSVRGDGGSHILFYIDLDHFKVVNDTCGHAAGDQFLGKVARLLREQIRSQDVLGRLGGDEFGLILTYCSADEAVTIGDKLLGALGSFRFTWGDDSFSTGASIGGVVVETGSSDASTLMSRAEIACSIAKEQGRNRVHMFHLGDIGNAGQSGMENWFSRIYRALDEDGFNLYAQPIVPVLGSADQPSSAEILIRMRGDDGAVIGPDAFMPAAEHYSLSPQIDRWVIETLLERYAGNCCDETGMFFVNLSGLTLGDETYIQEVSRLLGSELAGRPTVCFEITESAAIRNLDHARNFIDTFRALGCMFALDDFGSGFSSFGYLKALPVDYLKIDGNFVKNIDRDPQDQAVVRAIREVARAFGKMTVAEWVENEAALNMIRGIGVDCVQGFHVGKPLPLAEMRQ